MSKRYMAKLIAKNNTVLSGICRKVGSITKSLICLKYFKSLLYYFVVKYILIFK